MFHDSWAKDHNSRAIQSMMTLTKRFLDLLTFPSRCAFVQTAALCLRDGATGPEVMLVQTLRLRQWVIPKGWPMAGLTLSQAAAQEAWEEAGVRGRMSDDAVGTFTYTKTKKSGLPVQCCAHVFRMDVTSIADSYPEVGKRVRQWTPLADAPNLVRDPELAAILRAMAHPK